jgi:hypothetical protein
VFSRTPVGSTSVELEYCLNIPNAQSVDMKDGNGRIFFVSSRPESELKQLLEVQRSNESKVRQRLASFAPAAIPAHRFAGPLSLAKPRKTLAGAGGRGETGFLPGVQKPASPRWFRPLARCRQLTICMEARNRRENPSSVRH